MSNESNNTSSIISKVWSFCNPLRDIGVGYSDYLEQLTYLQKMPKASNLYRKSKPSPNATPKGSNNKTFEGKLAAQDPNDEPASVLLERIRAAKINTQKMPKASNLYSKNNPSHNPTPKGSNNKAFEGKLVAQDPNDEPASVLLEQIRAAKINTQKMPKASNLYRKSKPSHNPTPKGSNNKTFEGKLAAQDPNDEPASVLLERIKAVKINTQKMPKASNLYSKNKATHNPTPKGSNKNHNDEPAEQLLQRIRAAKENMQRKPPVSHFIKRINTIKL